MVGDRCLGGRRGECCLALRRTRAFQQEHLEAQLFVYDKPRQQHQRPQQISHQ